MTTAVAHAPVDKELLSRHKNDWPAFAREILGVYLDDDQEAILRSIQINPRTVVRSGHARGKDFVGAVAMLCFLYLYYPSKVICTAPTGRQVTHIMLAEAKKIWFATNARLKAEGGWKLGGRFLDAEIKMTDDPDWFLLGFKAGDKDKEAWTGFHSPNILLVVTEASGIDQDTFDSIEGLLTGNSRLYLALNPHRTTGEAYTAFKSPLFTKFTLNCLNAPNVLAKRTIIPGQVGWDWINTVMQKPGWVTPVSEPDPMHNDFEWDGRWYRPSDLFRIKVLGQWPEEPEGQLIPLAWIEAANNRWLEWQAKGENVPPAPLKLGVDVAGMGTDLQIFCWRYEDTVTKFQDFAKSDHMRTAGRIKNELGSHEDWWAFIDTIGEGAGVHSRLVEQEVNSISVKFSEAAKDKDNKPLHDLTGERTFSNMRAYCYWAVRDALDPQLDGRLALPPLDELAQDLTAVQWQLNSSGHIGLLSKDDIKQALGRSPDYGDALAQTYYPMPTKKVLQLFFSSKSKGNGGRNEKGST